MSKHDTFIDLCTQGRALAEDINSFIDEWHDSDVDNGEIYEFLGMTEEEYFTWVERPSVLKHIIFSRVRGVPLPKALEIEHASPMAARGAESNEIEELIQWLRATGRL